LPEGVTGRIVPLADVPVFNEDRKEHPDVAGPVRELRDTVSGADGIVFAGPEYNRSVTGALKNAIDWLSLGPDSPLNTKPAAIVGIGGGSGTGRSHRHLRDILAHNGLRIVAESKIVVAVAEGRFEGADLADRTVIADLHEMSRRPVAVIEQAARPIRSRSRDRCSLPGHPNGGSGRPFATSPSGATGRSSHSPPLPLASRRIPDGSAPS